jgi:hypothetical protein
MAEDKIVGIFAQFSLGHRLHQLLDRRDANQGECYRAGKFG